MSRFICAGCLETNQDPRHKGKGVVLGGIKYCRLCAEERLDEVAMSKLDIKVLISMLVIENELSYDEVRNRRR